MLLPIETDPLTPPRVSVLMPVFNCARFVEEAMRSVLAQSQRDIELIVIDDGSTDGSSDIIKRIALQDFRVVHRRQENQGVAAATNHALSLARAPYVAIFDADDVMLPDRLALQVDYLDTHPDIAVIGSQWYNADTEGRINGRGRHAVEPDTIRTLMFSYFSLHNPTTMVRREAIAAIGGYRTSPKHGAQDYELYSRMLSAGYRFANLPFPLLIWRMNPNGLTYGRGAEQTRHCLEIRQRTFGDLAERAPAEADRIAEALVRNFPDGNWFDAKAAHLLSETPQSEYQRRWEILAAEGRISALDSAAASWLINEPAHAPELASQLERASLSWLASLVTSRAGSGQPPPCGSTSMPDEHLNGVEVSVLVPTSTADTDLRDRVESALSQMEETGSEVLIFSTDGSRPNDSALPRDQRVCIVSDSDDKRGWGAALAAAKGRLLAFLEPNARHASGFLRQATAALQDLPMAPAVIVGPPEIFQADFVSQGGEPIPDPAPEPRWSRETLLGRDRCYISAFVVKREIVAGLPLQLGDTASVTGWCLARALLALHAPAVVDEHRTRIMLPSTGLSDNIMPLLVKRLVGWYFDSGLGAVPADHTWDSLPKETAWGLLDALDQQLARDALCIHPGNKMLLLRFVARFSTAPYREHCIRIMQMHEPQIVRTTLLAAGRPWSLAVLSMWRVKERFLRRSRRSFGTQRSEPIHQ